MHAEFLHCGLNVMIDETVRIYGSNSLWIGDNVRIDAYSVITAGPEIVYIGSYTHVASHSYLSGAQGGITIGYGSGIAPHCSLYSAVEDYSRGSLTNPSIDQKFRNTNTGRILIEPHVAIGSTSVVICGKRLRIGSAIGALSLVNRSTRRFEIVHGNPIRRVGYRESNTFGNESKRFLSELSVKDRIRLEEECSLFGIPLY